MKIKVITENVEATYNMSPGGSVEGLSAQLKKEFKDEKILFIGTTAQLKTWATKQIKSILLNAGDLLSQDELFKLQDLVKYI